MATQDSNNGKADLPVEIRRLPTLPSDVTDQVAMRVWWEQARRVFERANTEMYNKIPKATE